MTVEDPHERQIHPPFSEKQIEGLNWYQIHAPMHPFTCANRGDGNHPEASVLIAQADGWHCIWCSYRQSWAWEWMADPANFPSLF